MGLSFYNFSCRISIVLATKNEVLVKKVQNKEVDVPKNLDNVISSAPNDNEQSYILPVFENQPTYSNATFNTPEDSPDMKNNKLIDIAGGTFKTSSLFMLI
ncbi:hypothetical protein ABEB36_014636 [Hypothenemus hampei]|uniref:Uncharacterized protein n=1 Tax=Hypothenemus hampei TaxID=57062 RepID=A0ABD1E2D3_HYPHA